MKYEWLIDYQFKTRDEEKSAVFEYVEIFITDEGYMLPIITLTPEEYYLGRIAD
ncbi:hypothetical protein UFO1_4156 [Pelosinus sp. UFO1]|nr:hypothetical protein UFO1_4156 [Pelosinus sp. UFO1]